MADIFIKLDEVIGEGTPAEYPVEERPDIASYIDHTYLKPEGNLAKIRDLCAEAVEYNFCSVCVHPRYVEYCAQQLEGHPPKVCTVVGFPLGANTSKVKAQETQVAVGDGADEIDMVLAIGAFKDHLFLDVFNDVKAVVQAAHGKLVKVILETAYLSPEEIKLASIISQRAGAHYVKTSTGFAARGASLEDVRIMRETVGPEMGVKASGGIRDYETSKKMIEAGANRLGVSAGVAIVQGKTGNDSY